MNIELTIKQENAEIMVWDRVLTDDEIREVAVGCVPSGFSQPKETKQQQEEQDD